jgi:fumarylacetoacetate (FAA) hydrolase
MLDDGAAITQFLKFGDRVRICAVDQNGATPFGAIDQRVVEYMGP